MDLYDLVFLGLIFRELFGSTLDRVLAVMLLVMDALGML